MYEITQWFDKLKGKPGIALVQEPNNRKGKLSDLGKNLKAFGSDNGNNVRAAIITNKDFNC